MDTLLHFIEVDADAIGRHRFVTGVIGVSMLTHVPSGVKLAIWAERHDILNPCSSEYVTVSSLIRHSTPGFVYLFPEGLAETTESRQNGAIHAVLNDLIGQSDDVERKDADLLTHGKHDPDPLMAHFGVTQTRRSITLSASIAWLNPSRTPAKIVFTDFRDELDPHLIDSKAALATEIMSMFHTETLRTKPEQAALPHAMRRVSDAYITARVLGIIHRHFQYISSSDALTMAKTYFTRCTAWHKLVHERRDAVEHAALATMMPVFDIVLLLVIQDIVNSQTAYGRTVMHAFVGDGHRLTVQQMLTGDGDWRINHQFSTEQQDASCFDLQTTTFV